MAQFPYYTENTHDSGPWAVGAGNKVRTTIVSAAEGRLIVEVQNKIFLLDPISHPLSTLLTSVGKLPDGKGGWKGAGVSKVAVGNPEFGSI